MMEKILIIGSGASGVHFALSVLEKGYDVTMLDVGYEKGHHVNPNESLIELKRNLSDPVKYFLGKNYESVMYPDFKEEYYGFPPSKEYVFTKPPGFALRLSGFAPVFSFARGGLAEAWTGGVYPFNDTDLAAFPFDYGDIEPYYDEIAGRIGLVGARDDLERFFPYHRHIMEPLALDEHSRLIFESYENNKKYLNEQMRCFVGRSRLATLSNDMNGRKKCWYCGRCIWGCPSESFYTPSISLVQCMRFPNFRYVPNMFVSHFNFDSGQKIRTAVAESLTDEKWHEFRADKFVLAAGTLSSSRIFVNTIYKNTGEIIKLQGLMDNRQVFVPFINLDMIGKQYNPNSYQYHQLSMECLCESPGEYVDVQITTLKTAMIHPIIQNMLFNLKTSLFFFKNLHAALGLASVSFHDFRRDGNYLTIDVSGDREHSRLVIQYVPLAEEKNKIKRTVKRISKTLLRLRCIAPKIAVHIRPMGANIHYAGTIPMSETKQELTVSKYCQSHDFENLFLVDGTTFPWLPPKNLTFTLMANAVRVAENAF